MSQRLVFVGAGTMASSLIAGLRRDGWDAADLIAVERREEQRADLAERYGIRAVGDFAPVADADAVILGVKPQDLDAVLAELAGSLPASAVVISLCAGVSAERIETALAAGQPVVRVMPNTPALVGQGAAAISAGSHANDDQVQLAFRLLSSVGTAVVVPEHYQDAVTAISGSGPAYLFLIAESMIESGVQLGLPRNIASDLVVQTILGSAVLLHDSGTHPALLREQVTSPGGTTAAGLGKLEELRVRHAFASAIRAAHDRSVELGD